MPSKITLQPRAADSFEIDRHVQACPPRSLSLACPQRFKPCIATMSLGHPIKHSLPTKLRYASRAGFQGVEIYWDDLISFAARSLGDASAGSLRGASDFLRLLCDELGLTVVSLQPFRDFDGLEEGDEKEGRVREFKVWLSCAARLGAGMIGVPASIARERHDPERVVEDLEMLADLAAQNDPPVTVAYENLCFSAFNATWQRAWEAVSRAGRFRGNVGLVLDTFNIAGGIWSDPCRAEGLRPDRRALLERCLRDMPSAIPRGKVALVQIADGELVGAVEEGHALYSDSKKGCLKNWSRSCRLFPLEEGLGAHMPVVEMLKTITGSGGIGYEGWVSMEVFSRSTEGGEGCVEWHARRAWASWARLKSVMGWE